MKRFKVISLVAALIAVAFQLVPAQQADARHHHRRGYNNNNWGNNGRNYNNNGGGRHGRGHR